MKVRPRRRVVIVVLVLSAAVALAGSRLAAAPAGPASTRAWAVHGLYISWGCCRSEHSTAARLGFDAVSVAADRGRLDYLQSLGVKGLVWLGGYDNATCRFVFSDDKVRRKVKSIVGHPAVLAYEIDNEPHVYTCPSAPQSIRHRVALVRSLVGPHVILYITLSRDFASFAATGVDLIRISAYPCSYSEGCVMRKIVDRVAAARAAGFTRIWAGTQTAGDSYYRPPTPDELARIQQTWHDQGAEGYVAWAWDGHGSTRPLRTNTALRRTWKVENAK